jgi:hypothetical protein
MPVLTRKVVQRILGRATAAMIMDLYGLLVDQNLWDAAQRIGGAPGTSQDILLLGLAGEGVRHGLPSWLLC